MFLDDARVSDHYRLGPVDQGWAIASGALAAEHGMGSDGGHGPDRRTAELREAINATTGWLGVLQDALAAAERWAAAALRPDGSRVLDDPAVRARLARVALDCAVSEFTPNPYRRVVASDVFVRGVAELVELVGPAALIPEGEDGAVEDGVIEWAHRFAQGTSIYGGTTDIQRNLIAEHVLGLPRHHAVLRRCYR